MPYRLDAHILTVDANVIHKVDTGNPREYQEHEPPNPRELNFSVCGYMVSLKEEYDEHELAFLDWPLEKLNVYAPIFAARGFGRLGYTFPSNVCLDEALGFLCSLICIHRGNATHGAARCLGLISTLKSCDPRPQRESGTLLRDRRTFGRNWHLEAVPSDYFFSTFVRQLQDLIKCYKALGYRALENEIKMESPTRLLFNIYIMCNDKRAAPGRYAQPKTPPSLECRGRIEETHNLERCGTETPTKQKEDHTADDSTLHKCEHIRTATCRNLTSIALAYWGKVKDSPRYNIVQHSTVLRVCHLLFRAKQYKASHDKMLLEPCIKCISETFIRKQLKGGLEWAISETESLLSLPLSPRLEIYDRMRSCEEKLNIQQFHLSGKPLFEYPEQIIATLQFVPALYLEEKDYGVVRKSPEAQAIYAVACLLDSNYSPPNGLPQHRLLKVFDRFIRRLDHRNTATAYEEH